MALCYEGRLSLFCFFGTSNLVLLLSLSAFYFHLLPNIWGALFWGPIFYYALINITLRFLLKENNYQIAIRATFLGFAFACSILLFIYGPTRWKPFGAYATLMTIFHYSEFLAIAWSNPETLSTDSFILNHSVHYAVAAISSWVEFLIEVYFVPDIKEYTFITIIGVAICLGGEVLRKLAIITANSNFNHVVQFTKSESHELIKHGVYSYMRHPSYVGWFWWSIGTQIALINPICLILYTIISWRFFKERIFVEEYTLLNFFGFKYFEYQQEVPTGLPYINGYVIDKSHIFANNKYN